MNDGHSTTVKGIQETISLGAGPASDHPANLALRSSRRTVLAAGLASVAIGMNAKGALAQAVASGKEAVYAPEILRIKERGRIIVGTTRFASPPFTFIPKDTPESADLLSSLKGHDFKLMSALATALDVKLEINNQATSFNRVVDQVIAGEVDLALSKLSVTYTRAARVAFSDPYIELRHGILANRLAMARLAKTADLGDVLNKSFSGSIGVIAGSSFVEITRGLFPKASIRELPGWMEVVDAANLGRVDIAYRDELEIKRIMKLRPELAVNLRSVLVKDRRDYIAAALPWQSTQLTRFMSLVIARNKTAGANEMLEEYPEIFAL